MKEERYQVEREASALGRLDSSGSEEFWASLALKHTRGLGMRSCKKLLNHFGSAFGAVQNVRQWGDAKVGKDKSLEFLSEKWRPLAKEEWSKSRGCRGKILLWTDEHYPCLLKDLPDPPIFLYCLGDTSLLLNSCVAIVGTRKCSIYGIQKTRELAEGLSKSGVTVVSGLALGIDREAHGSSADFPGSTIAVIGSGIDVDYPRQNLDVRKKVAAAGLIVSEYAPGARPEPGFFPIRNRIISGISLGVLIVEATPRSGSLITARLALEQNRSVYAAPGEDGSPFSQGCRDIIAQGAYAISSVEDLLGDLFAPLKASLKKKDAGSEVQTKSRTLLKKKSLLPSKKISEPAVFPREEALERLVVEALKTDPKDMDALCSFLQVAPDSLASTLIMLEVRGVVKRLPSAQYMCVSA